MKFIGIIVEYNPFHNGHLYQINQIREIFNPDGIVVVMSGQFVQRGLPAIYDKWTRTELALEAGVDLVIELPTYYATSSAELFARGAIETLLSLGVITHFAFGSEFDSLTTLSKVAEIYHVEPPIYKQALSEALETGVPFHAARETALHKTIPELTDEELKALHKSNAILGIEYLKACHYYKADLIPILIKRQGAEYHDTSLNTSFASATAIRTLLEKGPLSTLSHEDLLVLKKVIPESVYRHLYHHSPTPITVDALYPFMRYQITQKSLDGLSTIRGVGEGLEHKIKQNVNQTMTYDTMMHALKSKRYAQTRLQRILLATYLSITPFAPSTTPTYIRILGANENGRKIIKRIKAKTPKILVTTASKQAKLLANDPHWQLDLLATDLYMLPQKNKTGGQDLLNPPVML